MIFEAIQIEKAREIELEIPPTGRIMSISI